MSELVEITTHADDAVARLTQVFREKPKIAAWVRARAERYQGLETVFREIKELRRLDNAVGAQLDGIGRIVGEARQGRTDSAYKRRIKARIAINTSRGTPENLINVFVLLTGVSRAFYAAYHPCEVTIDGDSNYQFEEDVEADDFAFECSADGSGFGDVFDDLTPGGFAQLLYYDMQELYDICQEVVTGGVKFEALGWFNGDVAFGFDDDPRALGFGDLYDDGVGGELAELVVP